MTRWARLGRGWAAALFASYTAAFSHVLAGGGHPPFFAMALALAFSGLACTALAGRRFSRVRLSVSVALSQFVFHGLFSLVGEETGATGRPAGDPALGPHNHTIMFTLPADAPAGIGGGLAPGLDLPMIAAHLAAAALTTLVFLHAERTLRGLSGHLALAVAALLRSSRSRPWRSRTAELWQAAQQHRVPASRRHAPAILRAATPRETRLIIGALRHRGPPRAPRPHSSAAFAAIHIH